MGVGSLKDMRRLDIVMAVPGMPFDGTTVKEKSLGGSETAGYYMALNLARLGHNVKVFCNCPRPGVYDGVEYLPLEGFLPYATIHRHDVCIVQRAPELFRDRLNSLVNILWCHDLAAKVREKEVLGVMWNVDRVMVVSEFMARQYREVYDLPEEALLVTRNGVDLELFLGLVNKLRDNKRLVYAARPERGLDVLLQQIFPKLLEKDPSYRLQLCGYDNPVTSMAAFYAEIDEMIKGFGDSVEWLGHLNKRQLYEVYAGAGAYVYPTPSPVLDNFYEVSCITAMECQAAGLPFIATDRGALRETVAPGAGVLLEGHPRDEDYADRFVEAVLRVTADPGHYSAAGRARAQELDWSGVARQWEDTFYDLIEEYNRSSERLVLHLLRQSDVIAAQKELANCSSEFRDRIERRIDREYWFLKDEESYREHYRIETEREHRKNLDRYLDAGPYRDSRMPLLASMVASSGENLRVLDIGCAHGNVAALLAEQMRGSMWSYTGVDIEPQVVEAANRFCDRWVKEEDRKRLAFITKDRLPMQMPQSFDVVILSEVLEHVKEPWTLVNEAEKYVKDGGKVFITVPVGPWEHEGYYDNAEREHVWEFDKHDLMEMFGQKHGVAISLNHVDMSILGTPLGHHFVSYTVTGDQRGKTGRIDLDRKLAFQRPRQTVSACLMAGPNSEEQLHWCLRSIRRVADEIIVVNNGMSEEAVRIADQYGVELVPGVDPRVEGFEVPRNLGLDRCSMDWVLWIDTDERLLGERALHKYLRDNIFQGYSIRQHHFAVDTAFNPDMPVRLFRNNGRIRFFGMIHEHPETGVNEGPGRVVVLADVHIAHTGYLNESIRRRRFVRNYPLLQKDIETYPDRKLQKHFIMRDNMLMVTYEMEMNGGRVSKEIEERCRQNIELYRKHFLGKDFIFGADTLQYYSQAVRILTAAGRERGFEVAMFLETSPTGEAPQGMPEKFWFASEEDAMKEISTRAETRLKQVSGEFVR